MDTYQRRSLLGWGASSAATVGLVGAALVGMGLVPLFSALGLDPVQHNDLFTAVSAVFGLLATGIGGAVGLAGVGATTGAIATAIGDDGVSGSARQLRVGLAGMGLIVQFVAVSCALGAEIVMVLGSTFLLWVMAGLSGVH